MLVVSAGVVTLPAPPEKDTLPIPLLMLHDVAFVTPDQESVAVLPEGMGPLLVKKLMVGGAEDE